MDKIVRLDVELDNFMLSGSHSNFQSHATTVKMSRMQGFYTIASVEGKPRGSNRSGDNSRIRIFDSESFTPSRPRYSYIAWYIT